MRPGVLLRVTLPCTLGAVLTAALDVGALDEKFWRTYSSSASFKLISKMFIYLGTQVFRNIKPLVIRVPTLIKFL